MNDTKTEINQEVLIKVPADFLAALNIDSVVYTQWNNLTPISQRDFISWVVSAKQSSTRARRIQVACSKLAAGQRRPCCYAVIPMGLYRALDTNPEAKNYWKGLSSDQRRDFADWIESAENKESKTKRIDEACELLSSGKLLQNNT